MGILIYPLFLIFDALAIHDLMRRNKDNEKKMLWIIVILLLPLLGPILYYVTGRNKSVRKFLNFD